MPRPVHLTAVPDLSSREPVCSRLLTLWWTGGIELTTALDHVTCEDCLKRAAVLILLGVKIP